MGERVTVDDFDETNRRGQAGELLVRQYGTLMAKGEAGCEVKTKTRRDLKVYVETEQVTRHGEGPVRPSGVHGTDAPLFCYVFDTTGWLIVGPTQHLRDVGPILGRPIQQPQAQAHGNPTRGFLVDLQRLLDRYMPDGSGWPVPAGGWKETDEL